MVWVWPQEELSAGGLQSPEAGFTAHEERGGVSYIRRFLPESLLRGGALDSGVELVQCSDGVEARAWRQGILYASNWWPRLPDSLAWTTFCRGAGMAPVPLPELKCVAWLDRPWTAAGNDALRDSIGAAQRYLVPIVSALLLAWASFQIGAIAHLKLAEISLGREIARSRAQVSDILSARSQAEDDLTQARKIFALRPPLPLLRLFAITAEILDQVGAALKGWSMPNPDHVEVTLSMPSPDPRALVLAFQKAGVFSDVSVDVGRASKDQIVIRARVRALPSGASRPSHTQGVGR